MEICQKVTTVVHYYTKYKVILHCFLCRLNQQSRMPELKAAQRYHWIPRDQLDNYGFPAGHRKFIEYLHQTSPETLEQGCP